MNKLYVVINEDRHCVVDVKLYSDKKYAIEVARKLAKDFCRHDDDYEEVDLNPSMIADGWLFYAIYSCEGDSVKVVKRVIDKTTKDLV